MTGGKWTAGGYPRALLLLFVLLLTQAGCYPNRGALFTRLADQTGIGRQTNVIAATPRMRVGALPFHAWYSPFTPPAQVSDLGEHRYIRPGLMRPRGNEVSRGVLYTRRAGFVDLAHIRNAVDLTRFVYEGLDRALAAGHTEMTFFAAEPDAYDLVLTLPEAWLAGGADDMRLQEVKLQIAGRMAYLMSTWHEVLTWYGYRGWWIFSEKASAFTYDDQVSHQIGVRLAMQVLRQDPQCLAFDQGVTEALAREIRRLGAVTVDESWERMYRVEGQWWEGTQALLRVIHLGQKDEVLVARVLEEDDQPLVWAWSGQHEIDGVPLADLYDVRIRLRTFERGRILRAMGLEGGFWQGGTVVPRRDFAALRVALQEAGHP